jgi:hypothetical protein
MFKKHKIEILLILSSFFLFLSLVGCIGSSTDEAQIMQIAKNIEKAIEKKEVDIFMENVSYDYSDSNGGTYDNHINGLPEEIFLDIENNENLANGFFSIFKIEPKVTIPESDLVLADLYASGKMEITISLKACLLWYLCKIIYNEKIEYNVDFQKEDDDWKIISMMEI